MVAVSDNTIHTSNLTIDGLNWYSYVGNNPLRWIDPTGLRLSDHRDPLDEEDYDYAPANTTTTTNDDDDDDSGSRGSGTGNTNPYQPQDPMDPNLRNDLNSLYESAQELIKQGILDDWILDFVSGVSDSSGITEYVLKVMTESGVDTGLPIVKETAGRVGLVADISATLLNATKASLLYSEGDELGALESAVDTVESAAYLGGLPAGAVATGVRYTTYEPAKIMAKVQCEYDADPVGL